MYMYIGLSYTPLGLTYYYPLQPQSQICQTISLASLPQPTEALVSLSNSLSGPSMVAAAANLLAAKSSDGAVILSSALPPVLSGLICIHWNCSN